MKTVTKQAHRTDLGLHRVRVVADYELLSMNDEETAPLDGEKWITEVLTQAKRAGIIEDYKIIGVHEGGPMGLQLIQFYVEVMQEEEHFAVARSLGETLLSEYVFHDKVEVRWVSIVDQA